MLSAKLEAVHEESRGTYGSPRLHAELVANGEKVGRKSVARLMRKAGLVGISPRKSTFTTVRDPAGRPSDDLVQRDFTATGPDQLWVADITYVPTWAGFLCLAVVLDVWSHACTRERQQTGRPVVGRRSILRQSGRREGRTR